MARRGCASGRRKQLQRLKKALFECRVFDPTIFDWAASAHTDKTPPVPPIYRSYVAPAPEELAIETAPAPTSAPISRVRLRAPTRLALSHMASVRLPTGHCQCRLKLRNESLNRHRQHRRQTRKTRSPKYKRYNQQGYQ